MKNIFPELRPGDHKNHTHNYDSVPYLYILIKLTSSFCREIFLFHKKTVFVNHTLGETTEGFTSGSNHSPAQGNPLYTMENMAQISLKLIIVYFVLPNKA